MLNLIIAFSLLAGLLAVDDRAGWQSLLAQPVFSALLVGFLTGEMATAVAVGLVLELIWLSILPMRGLKRPDQIAGGIVGAGTAGLLLSLTADPRIVFVAAVGVFVGLVAGEIGGRVTRPLYALQNRFLSNIKLDSGSQPRAMGHKLFWLQAGAIAYVFVVEAIVVGVLMVTCFYLAERFTLYVDGSIVAGVINWKILMPALGAASLIQLYWHHHLKRVLILSAVMVILVLWLR